MPKCIDSSVRSKKTSVRSKKEKKQKSSKKKVRRRTERRRQQQRGGKFQRASLMFFSYTRINCRYGLAIDKPIKQQSLQKHNRSTFLCICRFGDWNFSYTATLATKTFRLLPPWRVLLKRFFEPCISYSRFSKKKRSFQNTTPHVKFGLFLVQNGA